MHMYSLLGRHAHSLHLHWHPMDFALVGPFGDALSWQKLLRCAANITRCQSWRPRWPSICIRAAGSVRRASAPSAAIRKT